MKTRGWKYSPKTGGFQPNGRVGIAAVCFKDNFSQNIPIKLYQQHSERLSLRSSKTKSHQHLNIKEFVLNPCPKLIDVLI